MIKRRIIPAQKMSVMANRDMFQIPYSGAGAVICRLHVIWGVVGGRVQPCIWHPEVLYPAFRPATPEEVEDELAARERDETEL